MAPSALAVDSKAPDAEADAAREWAGLDKNSASMLRTFLSRHGKSGFAPYAQARLDELTQTAVVAPQRPAAVPERPADDACDDGLLVSAGLSTKRPCIRPGSGESFQDCPNCPEMVVVPSGSFAMGSPASEPEQILTMKGRSIR